jgi:hypothetical protein
LLEAIDFWAPNEPLFDTQNSTWSSTWVEKSIPEVGIGAIRNFLEKASGSESNFFFLNSGGVMNQISPRDTAFFWRNTRYYMEWDASWTDECETKKNIALVERTRLQLKPYITGSYVNVPDLSIKNYGEEYYGDNFERLKQIKKRYDPENIFNFVQSIPPAHMCGRKNIN